MEKVWNSVAAVEVTALVSSIPARRKAVPAANHDFSKY